MATRKADAVEINEETKQSVGTGLGDQVQPETMLTEDDGNRSLAHPAEDPGPVAREGTPLIRHPNHRDGQKTLEEANDFLTVTRRTSTAPDWYGKGDHNTDDHEMSPSVIGHAGASDKYHPNEDEKNFGDAALKKQARDPAPLNE